MDDKKLLLVYSEHRAAELRPYFSDEWEIRGVGSTLYGKRFSVILIVYSGQYWDTPERWHKYVDDLHTRLAPGGEVIEVY